MGCGLSSRTSGATCRIIDEEVVQTIWQPTGPLCPETTDESDENTTTAEEDQEFKRKLFEANKLIDKVKNTLKDLRMSVNVKKNIEGRKDECVECGETEMSCSFLEGQTAPKQTPRDDVAAGASKQADQRNRDSVRASVNLAQFLLTQPEDLAAAPKNLAKFIHAQLETLTQAAIASAHQQPVEKQDQGTIYARHCVSDLCLSQDLCCNVSNPICCRDDYSEGGKRTAAQGGGTAHANDGEMTSEEEMPMSVLNTIVEESEGDVASRTRTAAEAKESGRSMNKGAQERQENGASAGHSIREPPPLMDRSTSPIKTTTFDNTIEVHQDSSSHSEEQEVRNTYSTMVGQRPDKVSEYSDHIASTVHSRRSSVVAPISLDGDNENMTVQNIELLREKLERQRQKQLDDEREREKLLLDEQQTNGSLAEKSSIVTTCSQRCSERRRQSQIEKEQQPRQTNEGVPKRSSLAVCHQGGVDSCGSHSKPHEARGSFSVRLADAIAVQEIDPVAEESETLIAKTSFDNGNDLGPAKSPQMQIQKMPPVNIAPELTTQATLNLEIKPTDSGTNAVATDEAKNTNIGYFQVKRESVVEQPSNPEATTSLAEPKPKSGIKCGSCKKKAEIPLRRLTADPAEVMQKQVIRLEKQATPSTGSGTQPMKVQIELPVDLDQLNEDQEDDLVRLILKSYQCVKEGGSSHELDVLKDTSLGHLLSEVDLDVYRTYINPDYPAKSKKDEKKAEQEEKIQQVKELVKAYVQRTILPESIVDTLVIQSTDPHSIGFYETKSCQTSFDSMYTDQFYNSQFGVKSPPDGAASGSAYEDAPERDVFSRRRGSGSSSRSTSSSDSRNNNIKIQCSLSNSEEETSSSASLVSTTISHFLGGLVEQPNAVKATPKQEDDDQSKKERSNEPSSSVDEETKPEQPEDQQAQEESKTPSMKDDGSSKKPPKNNVSIKRGSKSPNDSMDGQKLAEKWNKLIEKEPPVAVGAELTTTKEAFQSGSPDNLTVLRVSPESPPPRLKAGKDEILGRLSEYTSRVECLRPTTCRSLKRQHYRTEASTSDSVSVRESSARGESSRCPKSSLSGGEIRETCKDLHGRTYNIRYLKKHPEKMLQCELDDKTLKLSRQRKYYSHWIAYYVQKHKRVPDEEDKANVPSPSNSRKSPKGK